jgi:hypothetical protein
MGLGRKSGLVVSKLDSRSKGRVFESRLIHNTRCKWSTFKAMPGSIPAPNSGSFVEKNIGSKWGKPTKNKHFKQVKVKKNYDLFQGLKLKFIGGPHFKRKMLAGPQFFSKSFFGPQFTRKALNVK